MTLESICQCEEVKKKLLKLSPDHSKKIKATFHAKYGSDGAQSEAQYEGYKDKEKVDDKSSMYQNVLPSLWKPFVKATLSVSAIKFITHTINTNFTRF